MAVTMIVERKAEQEQKPKSRKAEQEQKPKPTVGDLVRVVRRTSHDDGAMKSRALCFMGKTGRITTDDGTRQPYQIEGLGDVWFYDDEVMFAGVFREIRNGEFAEVLDKQKLQQERQEQRQERERKHREWLERQPEKERKHREWLEGKPERERKHREWLERQARKAAKSSEDASTEASEWGEDLPVPVKDPFTFTADEWILLLTVKKKLREIEAIESRVLEGKKVDVLQLARTQRRAEYEGCLVMVKERAGYTKPSDDVLQLAKAQRRAEKEAQRRAEKEDAWSW